LLELARPRGTGGRILLGVLADVPESEVFRNLSEFLGRLFLRDPVDQQAQALRLLVRGTRLYLDIPAGTVDYLGRLYRHVLLNIRPAEEPLPAVLPGDPRPPWFSALEQAEQQFIEHALAWLSEPDVVLLYLQMYGRLTAAQIAAAFHEHGRLWTPDRVIRRLEQCWGVVLQ
jgi:hypothetical protein